MKNKLTVLSIMLLAIGFSFLPAARAMDGDDHTMGEVKGSATLESLQASPTQAKDGSIQMNNELCPISGDKANDKSVVSHDGVSYRLCCQMCASKIEKNPAKYTVSKVMILEKIGA